MEEIKIAGAASQLLGYLIFESYTHFPILFFNSSMLSTPNKICIFLQYLRDFILSHSSCLF